MEMDVIKEQTGNEKRENYIGWVKYLTRVSVEDCLFTEFEVIDEYYLNYNKEGELIGYKVYQYFFECGELKKYNTWGRDGKIYNNINYYKFSEYFTKEYLLELANRPYEIKEKDSF